MRWKEFFHNRWVQFGLVALLYVLWVIWLGRYWWLLGLVVIYDLFISKKVKWLFWKKDYKEGEKHNLALDLVDDIIFAVVFVTFINIFFFQAFKIPSSSMERTLYTGDHLFVSKLAYGPRMPQTPLTVPFTHNVIFGKESYSTLIQKDYRRLKGFRNVRRGDNVVFGFPHGDTVLVKAPADDYYALCRMLGREETLRRFGPVKVRPADKKDHYVKRCVAIPGDNLEVREGQVYIDGVPQQIYPGIQLTYQVRTTGQRINAKVLSKIGIEPEEAWFDPALPGYPGLALTAQMAEEIKAVGNVESVEALIDSYPPDYPDDGTTLFPFEGNFPWTRDFYGPLWIPKKGETIALTEENLPLYRRIIEIYEKGDVSKALAEGRYTFAQDYYFMMGDNRHNSLDSRYWGFVPEDHIVGRPSLVWLSTRSGAKFPKNIRWKRFFKFV